MGRAMKTRESGMPDESAWNAFFDPPSILAKLGLDASRRCVVEFGCGYGTFTVAAARACGGTVLAMDIEEDMIAATARKAERLGISNVQLHLHDFVSQGTGISDGTADYAMLFNILHAEQPIALLREAWRILAPGGSVGIIHWNFDPATPRGPSMGIRPRPEQCREWTRQAGFELIQPHVDLPPHHYGIAGRKP